MIRALMIGAISATALTPSADTSAQQKTRTADEAKVMLLKTVATMKADETKAIDMINKREGGFLVGDLYPVLFWDQRRQGRCHCPQLQKFIGTDVRSLKDPTGKVFGLDIFAAAKEGQVTEVRGYMFPRPGNDRAAQRGSPLH